MNTHRRLLAALLVAGALSTAAVGCGVDVKDNAEGSSSETVPEVDLPTTTDGSDRTTTTDGSSDTTEPDTTDTTDGGSTSLPDDFDEMVRDQLVTSFKSIGLTQSEAECLADGYLEEFGTDASTTPDFSKMFDLFGDCDIDPTKIGTGAGG